MVIRRDDRPLPALKVAERGRERWALDVQRGKSGSNAGDFLSFLAIFFDHRGSLEDQAPALFSACRAIVCGRNSVIGLLTNRRNWRSS